MTSLLRISFQNFLRDEQGQDLIEYTLLMAFIALASKRKSVRRVGIVALLVNIAILSFVLDNIFLFTRS